MRSMSQITCDLSSAAQGSLSNTNHLNEDLFNQLQLALAVKMGLNGPEQVKERALHNVLTSKTAQRDMRQVLQSRAEISRRRVGPKLVQNESGSRSQSKDPEGEEPCSGPIDRCSTTSSPAGGVELSTVNDER